MDDNWAIEQLRHFIELTRLQQPRSDGGVVYMGDFAAPVGSRSEIVASDYVNPSWPRRDGCIWPHHRQLLDDAAR